ncbi:MAG TPA: BamA/TamA family outer membrane protein, partial [Chitinophagaceae bacterium]|nr:BamA/TamA family outer membrane protein [Chitinophagaceae bacterium]
DSQWWLQQNEKPGVESNCDFKTEDEIIIALKDIIGTYPDKLIILAMHHPLYSDGKPGGASKIKQQYKNMINQVEEALRFHPNVIQAAAHNHSLQFLQHDSISFIVSGAGSETTSIKKERNSLFAKSENGFAMVEVSTDGKVAVKFYTVESNDLQQSVYAASLNSLPTTKPDITEVVKSFPDSVTVIGSGKFKSGSFKNFLLGKNYRKEWKTPVRVRVMDMGKEFGGLTPIKRGGGHQTKSLRLEDPTGKEYVLRLVEKSVTEAALPPDLRGVTVAKDLISDGVSASYPYAALSVPPFANAAHVPHANPELIYMPDDPRLGKYRTDFANAFCILEERIPGGETKKTYSTDEIADKLHEDNDNTVDQKAMLQARLLDMFIMDFDRHEDQWIWGARDNGKGKIFYPLPRDRDQPFFISKGFLPSVARKPWVSPQIQGFRAKAININTYNFNAKNMDRAFLNELNEEDWQKMTDEFLSKMTDELIEQSLHLQPKEIRALPRNQEIIQKLKERRKYYTGEMMEYYRFISKIVNVTGSDKKELFDITRNNDGSVLVQVFKITREGEQSKKIYERKFAPPVTKEIRLYGMGGDDKFVIHGSGNQIKIRMIGGSGNDVFESNASSPAGKNIVYDLNTEENQFAGNNNMRQKLSDDPEVNKYERLYYKYDLNIPFVSVSYNPDDGLFLGASLKMIRQGFRKTPYKAMHQFAVNHALATNAYNFKWHSEFIGALGKKSDLLFDADIKAPNNTTNFFGYGNATSFVKTNPGKFRYYRARYQLGDISILVRKKFTPWLYVTFGPTYEFYSLDHDKNINRYILQTASNGIDPKTIFKDQSYAGGKLLLNIDFRNHKIMPTKGINWQTSLRVLNGLNDASKNLTQLNSDMSLYFSFNRKANFVIATRFGAAKNFGEGFEFYQAQYLGSTENLRGYRKYRFAGQSMAFNNTEIRFKIADFRTYLFPGALGLFIFHDIGHVWAKNDFTVSKWHTGYGGGLWFSPMSRLVITAAYTVSKEDKLPLVTFGWQF